MSYSDLKYMVSFFMPGTNIEQAAKACIETAALNKCTVFMDFNGCYIPVTNKMKVNSVLALYYWLLEYPCSP